MDSGKTVKVRFKKDFDEFAWENGKTYGPFNQGAVVELPSELVRFLKEKGVIEILQDSKSLANLERFLIASNDKIRVWLFVAKRGAFMTITSKDSKARVPVNLIESIRALRKLQELIREVIGR